MPRYDWKCSCGATTEVTRRMDDSDVGPYGPCARCSGTSFTKKMPKTYGHVVGGGSASGVWPLRIPKLEKVMLRQPDGSFVMDHQGLPVVERRDVVFGSLSEQNEYLNRRGLARMMDGEADSTVNEESTHSVYHQGDIASPSEAATRLHENSFFTEDPASVGELLVESRAQPTQPSL